MPENDFSGFKDILEHHRNGNDFEWITRMINFKDAYNIDRPPVPPRALISIVHQNKDLLLKIKNVLGEQHLTLPEIKKSTKVILEEIGYLRDLSVVRWLGLALLKILKKILRGLYVNEYILKQITHNMGNSPVIFVPTHRSYADFILMAFACFSYEIQIPCVAAGMDFHSMWLMGKLLRASKAFYMRRTFSDNLTYRLIFEDYVRSMVALGESPIEFFIEGTRSRSAKSLMPKLGFLGMVLEPFFSGDVPDITIVPVSINYDRLLEEVLFAYEHLGIPKPKESTVGLFKALNTLDQTYGNVHMNFTKPISARTFFDDCLNFSKRSKEREHRQIVKLAHTIVNRHQEAQIFGCFNLISIILSNNQINEVHELTLQQLVLDVAWLITIFEKLGATVFITGSIESSVKDAIIEHKNVVRLSKCKQIKIVQTFGLEQKKSALQGDVLSGNVMDESVPRMVLQLYVNPCMYLFYRLGFITTLLNSKIYSTRATKDELLSNYETLSLLFSHEFVILPNALQEDFEEGLRQLELLNVIQTDGINVKLGKETKLIELICNLLYPFLAGYFILCTVLSEDFEIKKKEKQVLQQSQILARKLLNSGEIKHHYTLSLNLLSCALRSMTIMGVIVKEKEHGEVVLRVKWSNFSVVWELLSCMIHLPGSAHSSFDQRGFFVRPIEQMAKL